METGSNDEKSGEMEFGGYTPLSDCVNTTAMFSTGPDEENGAVFFADLSAFQSANDDEEEDNEIDFRLIADQALSSLDHEYRMTVQPPSSSSMQQQSTASKEAAKTEPIPPFTLASEEYGQAYFPVDFCDDDQLQQPSAAPPRELPEIDSDAVRRAIETLQVKDDSLRTKFAKWQHDKLLEHALIPDKILKAFTRNTPKAMQASAKLTRAATIAEAIERLNMVDEQEELRIDIVGCDGVECSDKQTIVQVFGPLVQWLDAASSRVVHLTLNLIGPNIPTSAPVSVDFGQVFTCDRLRSAKALVHKGVYEDIAETDPTFMVTFHAGLWGYSEWRPTLEYLLQLKRKVPFVITSYSVEEGESDAEVMEEVLGDAKESLSVWKVEKNPFCSRVERVTTTAPQGHDYRENAAWQAWRL